MKGKNRGDSFQNKIKTLDELEKIAAALKKAGKRLVQCHGVFDLLHPGHILHFEAAKKEGDILIVTITPDEFVGKGPGRPVFNQRLRAESVAALSCVDYVAINQWPTAVETIKRIKPDIYAKGSDYQNPEDDLTGKISEEEAAITSVGGRIHFTHELSFSSSELLNRHYAVYPSQTQSYLESFRKKYTSQQVIEALKSLEDLKVLLIGEAIVDEYHYCIPMGKTLKENIVASRYLREESFAGGILACANHVAGFCKNVRLVTLLGKQDSKKDFILKHLKSNVKPKFFYRNDAPTIVKRRYVYELYMTKMYEIYFFNDSPLSPPAEKELLSYLKTVVPQVDLVLVADYGHGFLTHPIIHFLCSHAKFMAVNAQVNSGNMGFNTIVKYPRVDYVCVDEPEMRLAQRDNFADLKDLILKTSRQLRCNTVTVTRGAAGSLSYAPKRGFIETPSFTKEIVDRIGAGDAFLSITAPCVVKKLPLELISFIGNAVGALAVKIVGNRNAVEPVPLFKFITALLK